MLKEEEGMLRGRKECRGEEGMSRVEYELN